MTRRSGQMCQLCPSHHADIKWDRMIQDVAFISSRLSTLSESGKNVASLETLVKDKPTPRRPMGQTMAGLLRKASAATSPKTTEQGPKEEAKRPNGDVPLDEDEDGVGMVEEPSPIERAQAGAARTIQSHATEEATADGHGNLAVSNRNTESVGNAPNSPDENSVSVPTMGSPLKDDPIPPQPDPVAPNDELLLPASPIADPPAPPAKNGGADEGKDTPLPVIPTGAVEDTPLPAIPEKDDA